MAEQSEIRYLNAPTIDTKRKKYCRFKKSGIKYIDYKDPEFLKKFLNEQGKILPRRITGTSLKYQRRVAQAVKRARIMEIILKEDIIGLGFKNDIVNVKSGYGRNYLIPQGKGVIASPMAKKILAENLKQQAHKIAAQKAAAEQKAAQLEGVALEIAAKVSATGQLYGSVGAAQVADELVKLGKDVDRKIITMKDAKKLGDYVALVHFHKEVTVEIPVKVVAENAAELKAAAEAEEAIKAAAEARTAAAKAAAEAEANEAEAEVEAAPAEEEAPAEA